MRSRPPAPPLLPSREAMGALDGDQVRIRVGVHSGEPLLNPPKYTGLDVHLAARIMSAGHGGQVLLSRTTRELVDVEALDLGEHRLKDFDQPVRLYQLGDRAVPAAQDDLEHELARPGHVVRRSRSGARRGRGAARVDARLLTVTGPGGTGKTRFAVELASRHTDAFEHGVFWVPLAPIRDPALVMETLAQTLGARGSPAEHVADRQILIVLDNFEHVVDAATELGPLLAACPNLRALVTSRELLRLQGEAEYALPPLEINEGVALFCERARLEPSAAIEELCERLDSLPLAIELAAASTRMLSPEQLLARLGQRLDLLKGGRDADARQRTLRATIAWSYDLLAPDEQALLSRLSVFVGGWTLEAAEAVCGAELDELVSLLDKSLIRRSGERYWMLETIREFAAEQAADTTALADRHLRWFLALAEEADVETMTGDRKIWFDRLEADHANLRAAIACAAGAGETEAHVQLASALWKFWADRGYIAEGQRQLDDAIGRTTSPSVAARIGRVYFASVTSSSTVDLLAEAEALEAECAGAGDRYNRIRALVLIGMFNLWLGPCTPAEDALLRALALSGGDFPAEEAEAVSWLLITAFYGPLPADEGIARCKEAYERYADNRRIQAIALAERAPLEAMRGEFDIARQIHADGQAILGELGLKLWAANLAQESHIVETLAGNPAGAADSLRAACEVLEEAGERGFLSTNAGYLAHALVALGDIAGAEQYAALCAEAASPDDSFSQCLWRSARAKLLAAAGETERAVEYAEEGLRMITGETDDRIGTQADRLTDLAQVLAAAGRDGEAASALEQALALYERKGNLVAAGRTRAALAAS